MAEALLLDFDGLILDTETGDFESWRSVYEDYGVELPRDRWLAAIGTDGSSFDPHAWLERATGRSLDENEVQTARRARRDVLFEGLAPLPGVTDWIDSAKQRGLAVAVVSSSPTAWVEGHLARVDLSAPIDFLMTRDHVERVKPYPDLYEQALAKLGVPPSAALAVEDSPHGLSAAKAAGIFCIAVPGPMTRGLSFEAADLVLDSLAERSLESVLALTG